MRDWVAVLIWSPHYVVGKKVLLLDLLAIHMVRKANDSTIISYHPTTEGSTTAEELFTRLKLVGRSVYWFEIVYSQL